MLIYGLALALALAAVILTAVAAYGRAPLWIPVALLAILALLKAWPVR
jgi:hypothetical protein